jgi:hypothetical protein
LWTTTSPLVSFGAFGSPGFELLLAQPAGGDAGGFVGLRRSVEEADGGHDVPAVVTGTG